MERHQQINKDGKKNMDDATMMIRILKKSNMNWQQCGDVGNGPTIDHIDYEDIHVSSNTSYG